MILQITKLISQKKRNKYFYPPSPHYAKASSGYEGGLLLYIYILPNMKKVIIASSNPAKIEAVREGFSKVFPNEEFEYEGIAVPSNVSDQPMGNTETLTGAINRADNAKTAAPKADYWVGLEGGVEDNEHGLRSIVWICVKSNDQEGFAQPGSFYLPPKVAELVKGGMELGLADDIVFKTKNSKHNEGAVGHLTHNLYSRAQYYAIGVELALVPFINPDLYPTI
jgi:inosine/xanthosine triphosphatase